MPLSDGIPSSPPGSSTSPVDAIAYYKAQYETLESELADFQSSSKELEAELEKDIEASEKRERQLKEKADNLTYEVDEWKTKYKQSKAEANAVQNTLQKEITTLRDTNRNFQMRLRDIEVANDDYERQQRNTESSLEDMESKYSMAIERSVMMEEEVKVGEQEREAFRIDTQRLRDELSDLRIEAEIVKEKLRKAEENVDHRRQFPSLQTVPPSASPRSEISPTTTDSTPSFDTPPGKTVSSSGLSDTHTPPSPPISERSTNVTRPLKTPSIPKTRMSITSNKTTPRPSTYSLKPPGHSRGPSVPVASGRSTPSTNFRSSISRPSTVPHRQAGLPQSNSIYHLHNLQGKMQRLTERVHTAKSKLPAPVSTPPRSSPRTGPAAATIGTNIPATVTMRSSRKRANGSTIHGPASLPTPSPSHSHSRQPSPTTSTSIKTPTSTIHHKTSRQSLTMPPPPAATPTRPSSKDKSSNNAAAPPSFARPSSRASASTNPKPSPTPYQPGHSRPSSRTSMSISLTNARGGGPLVRPGLGLGSSSSGGGSGRRSAQFTPNASTDKIRPKSSLSNHGGYDGAMDDDHQDGEAEAGADGDGGAGAGAGAGEDVEGEGDMATPTPRRLARPGSRLSDLGVSTGIPGPVGPAGGKRTSISRLPAPIGSGRVSFGSGRGNDDVGSAVRPGSSRSNQSFLGDGVEEEEAEEAQTFGRSGF